MLVAARTLDATHAGAAHVTIVEPGDRLAAGVAYGTDDPEHLLNVRASGMSADPSEPDDLVRWLAGQREAGPGEAGPDAFVARRQYREYLADHLDRAAAQAPDGTLEVVRDRAIGVDLAGGQALVRLASGATLPADRVVLAIGNPAPAVPEALRGLAGHPSWVPDPWGPRALEPLLDAARIVLVGTGLTMVDIAITLAREAARRGATPELLALSRNGLVPTRHLVRQPQRTLDVIDLQRDSTDVLALQERLRARMRDGVGREHPDEDWREVIDAVRPFVNALWRRFDETQQALFLARAARQWDVHRHRMAPATARRLDALCQGGQLTTHTGHVVNAVPHGATHISLAVELDGRVRTLEVDGVVNCTGPGRSWLPPANPIVADLVGRGLATPDRHGLGLATTAQGSLIDVAGHPVPQILVVGPPRRGTLFETTAVPELRSQALHIADLLVIGDS